jgi:hypothetical protein
VVSVETTRLVLQPIANPRQLPLKMAVTQIGFARPTASQARFNAMHKVALVIYSKLEGSGNSAIYRSLMFAQELQRAGDDVSIVFDGAGSVAAAEMSQPGHKFHALLQSVRTHVRGVCRYCAKSYGVLETVEAAGLPLLGDDRGHASLRALLQEGRQIITV